MACTLNASNMSSKLKLLTTLPTTRIDCPREKMFERKREKNKLIEVRNNDHRKHMQDVKQRKKDHEKFQREECLINLNRRPPQERQVRAVLVHTPEHLTAIKQRRLHHEKVRNQQVLEDLSIKEKKKHPPKSLKPEATQNKQKEAEQRRLDLAQMRQAEVKNELRNKEMRAEYRVKEQENIHKLKSKNLMQKNKLLHQKNKSRRVAAEEQLKKNNENDLALKELRTNKNLGIEIIPQIKPKTKKKVFP